MDPIFIIIIIFVGFSIGGVTGYLAGKKSKKPVEKTSVNLSMGRGLVKPEFTREGYLSLLRLLRKDEDAGLATEIDGVIFPDRKSLPEETIQRLEGIGREWMAWLGVNEGQTGQSAPAPAAQNQSLIPPVKNVQQEKKFSSPLIQPDVLVDTGSKRIEAEQNIKLWRAKTIAEQIDGILQEKILDSGLTGKEIRIYEDLSHSVVFQIGLKNYQSLDQIEDQEALLMIRSAVAEWEKRTANLHRR
ncbi:MAG: hypothetical protein LLG42_06885 [Chloroflexi bacterium]|nr:hypothetical protein [Chloroflexota bacterium]